ncbi:MAG: hypothetical protein Q8R24_07955 [Legionellaceae bacterium]|nr:hypothetical protein [Legionellaceae bacterium]
MSLIDLEDTPTPTPLGLEAAVVEMVTRYLAENRARPNVDLYDFILHEDRIVPPNIFGLFSSHLRPAQPTIVTEHVADEPANESLKGNHSNA